MTLYTGAISAEARGALRSAITNHAGWDAHRRANNLSLASMTRDDYLRAAHALGIDVGAIVAPHASGRAPQNRQSNAGPAAPRSAFVDPAYDRESAASGIDWQAVRESHAQAIATARTATEHDAALARAAATAAAEFAAADEAQNGQTNAPEFDMMALPPIPAPIGDATLAKIDSLVRLAVGDDISIRDLYRTARLTAWCADALKTEVETLRSAPPAVIDPREQTIREMQAPGLDFVPPSWTREFSDYLHIGATVAVVGPSGNGKTTGARKLLERAGWTVYEFDCTDATLPQDLIGRTALRQDNGATVTEFQLGPIARAFADPKGAVLLNEYDALDPRTGMALQSALETANDGARRVTAPDTGEQLTSKGACPIVLTLNTIGHGATVEYQGRNALDGANRDRIEIISTGYENEREILTAHGATAETAERIVNWATATRAALANINSREILSNRRLLTAASLMDRCAYSLTDAVQRAFLCRLSENERKALAA